MAGQRPHRAMENLKLDDSYSLVAAIDFGTTFSGYAFSLKESPNVININKNWGSSITSSKTPTVVLTNPDGTFNSFGYVAEEEYLQHEPEEDYEIYRCFKMVLHKKVSACYNVPKVCHKYGYGKLLHITKTGSVHTASINLNQ